MRNLRTVVLACACAVMGADLWGQALPTATARTDAQEIMIGDQARLWLEARPGKGTVAWPRLNQLPKGLELIEKGPIDTLNDEQGLLLRQCVTFTSFDAGEYYIPSLAFRLKEGGQTVELRTDSLPILVHTMEVDTTAAFKPIKDIVTVPLRWTDYALPIALQVLAFVALALLIYFSWRSRKGISRKLVRRPDEKPHERALRLLEELKEKPYAEQGKTKEYYSELSDIVRAYLEERWGIPAMERTTQELMSDIKKQQEARQELRNMRSRLRLVLETADLAKFAKASPTVDSQTACWTAAKELVEATIPKTEEGKI